MSYTYLVDILRSMFRNYNPLTVLSFVSSRLAKIGTMVPAYGMEMVMNSIISDLITYGTVQKTNEGTVRESVGLKTQRLLHAPVLQLEMAQYGTNESVRNNKL